MLVGMSECTEDAKAGINGSKYDMWVHARLAEDC